MSEPIKETTDLKTAALTAILEKLEAIDTNASTRGTFGASIMFNQINGLDTPVFSNETTVIRHALGLPLLCEPDPDEKQEQPAVMAEDKPRFSLEDL